MNIYGKLAALCSFIVIFSVGVISYFADQQMKNTLKREIATNLEKQSSDISSNIGRFMFSRINDIKIAARNPLLASTNDKEKLIKRLQKIEEIDDIFYSLSIYNKDRLRVADSKRLSIGKKHKASSYWTQLENGKEVVIDISKSESVGKVVMHFAAKIIGENNQYSGDVLVGRVLINELFSLIDGSAEGFSEGNSFDINLINESGTLLYSSTNPEKVLIDKYENIGIVNQVPSNKKEVNTIENDDMLYFISDKIGYRSYSGNKWTLILSIDKEKVYMPVAEIRKKMMLIAIPVLIASILFSLLLAKFIAKPIINLSNLSKKIARGELNVKIPTHYSGEMGVLSRQLSQTTKSLIGQIEEQKQSNIKLQKQKAQIEEQNEFIQDVSNKVNESISYAEKIQRAALPPLSTLQNVFPQSFVMFKPKDVIGGDFYWYESIRKGNSEYMIIACADCTGHGVPGAIMSIMGSNQLTNIIYYQNYLDPKKIITRLDKNIKFELQRETPNKEESSKDGMEIAICVIDLDTLRMDFAGVGIPLRIVKNNSDEMTIYKSPKLMAGGMTGDEREVNESLKKETIQLDPGDKIYLSSDGYQDQFGGPKDKKFMTRKFNEMLESSSKMSMLDQKNHIEKTFKDWTVNTKQTDDVMVIGFEVV